MDLFCVFFQAEDGIRDLVRSRGLGEVYKRQPRQQSQRARPVQGSSTRGRVPVRQRARPAQGASGPTRGPTREPQTLRGRRSVSYTHLTLPTSDLG